MGEDYKTLSPALKLRVDSHVLDYFRDNDAGFVNHFRRMVLETAHINPKIINKPSKAELEKAYSAVLQEVRDGLAEVVEKLPAMKSEAVGLDLGMVRHGLEKDFSALVVEELTDDKYNKLSFYTESVERLLAGIKAKTKSDLGVSTFKSKEIPNYLGSRSENWRFENLTREYGVEITDQVRKLNTSLGNRGEAVALKVAVDAINKADFIDALISGGEFAGTQAVAGLLGKKGITLTEGEVSQIVTSAKSIAEKDGIGRK